MSREKKQDVSRMTPADLAEMWTAKASGARIHSVSFKTSEGVLNKLEALQEKYPHVTLSSMLHDIVGLGLTAFLEMDYMKESV